MLQHVIDRVINSKYINKLIVATSTNIKDDLIEYFCKKNNLSYYRGSQDDVLDRYYQVAKLWQLDSLVRITADCPLIDPEIINKLISEYIKNKDILNGASNIVKRTYPRGLDIELLSFKTIEKVWKEAKKDYQREHVTIYIYENLDKFKIYSLESKENLSHLRWTVDEEKDLKFIREIYKRLYYKGKIFLTHDILNLLIKEKHLNDINKDLKQKEIMKWKF